ncbi:subtilisin-like protease SBT3 [Coffea arabica]|uniref:Subtilisin-like protease SBT3 n=1 Tax=Coffea arabica TaxID=13443 RepID=A0A6P6USR8_COFAR
MEPIKVYLLQLFTLFLAVAVLSSATALESAERSSFIIHMDHSLMPLVFSNQEQWYLNAMSNLKSMNHPNPHRHQSQPKLLYTYRHAIHGFSAMLSTNELEYLKKLPGFLSAYKDKVGTLDTTYTYKFLQLNHADGLWPASDFGNDVIVGVIDTGVWPESPSYRDGGMPKVPSRWKGRCAGGDSEDFNSSLCNKKLIGVRYFYQGILAANGGNGEQNKFTARDGKGHGTHISSIIAGNYVKQASFFGYGTGTARGIAPKARLAIYKVSWEEQDPYESDVVAGIDQALADGVDIISLSLGFSGASLYEDPVAIASFSAMQQNVFVSCSAGNDGEFGIGSLHNGIPWSLTVAASSTDRRFCGTLCLGNGVNLNGWTLFPARAVIKDSPLIYNKSISACFPVELLDKLSGGIVICNVSKFSAFLAQMSSVSKSRVKAAIFVSSDPQIFEEASFEYPGVVISPSDAAQVIKYALTSYQPSASIQFQKTCLHSKRAPGVASYSSRGPAPSFPQILKPDLMAPGTQVLAAWNPTKPVASIGFNIQLSSDFNLASGTSMACPHVSGVAALLKGAHPEWSPAAIRSAMVTTANPLDNTGNPIQDIGFNNTIATPLSMGAGEVSPNSALNPGLIYNATTEDYINLLCSTNYTWKQIKIITRSNYSCSNASSDMNYPSFIALYNNTTKNVLKQRFQRTVTNVGNGAAIYKAQVTAPKGSAVTVYPEILVFGKKYEEQSYVLTIQYNANQNKTITFGSIVWVEVDGKHIVRSPIAVAPMIEVCCG